MGGEGGKEGMGKSSIEGENLVFLLIASNTADPLSTSNGTRFQAQSEISKNQGRKTNCSTKATDCSCPTEGRMPDLTLTTGGSFSGGSNI